MDRTVSRAFVACVFLIGSAFLFIGFLIVAKEKDKTPPVISNVHATAQSTEATVAWTTDEPADSDIEYGISPKTNIHGDLDGTLVTEHSMPVTGLVPDTSYDFCVLSRDADNNKAQACGSFVTTTAPPPSTVGGGSTRPTLASVSGLAYPGAHIVATLRGIFFGALLTSETLASEDGSFTASFRAFPQGLYMLSVSAYDKNGVFSVVRQFQFNFSSGDAPLIKDVLMPPTITLAQDRVAWGDNLKVSGYAVPQHNVLVEIGGISYETKSDGQGAYEVLINTARLSAGKWSVRARTLAPSGPESGHSFSKSFTIVKNFVPQADLNGDGVVDLTDASIFLMRPIDLNKDGKINSSDVSIFLQAFNPAFRTI